MRPVSRSHTSRSPKTRSARRQFFIRPSLRRCLLAIGGLAFVAGALAPTPSTDLLRGFSFNQPVFAAGITVEGNHQGDQVRINGSTVPIAWNAQSGRVGVADTGLWRHLSLALLDTSDPSQQPVQWFSDPAVQPIVLSAWNDGQFRYLDIVPLAEAMGWAVSQSGSVLQIDTPPAEILSVRRGLQSWGDRFVVDLEGSTTWNVTPQSNGFQLQISGTMNDGAIAAANIDTRPGNRFARYSVQRSGDQTILQVSGTDGTTPIFFTLPNPNRLVIDLRPDDAPMRNIQWSSGLRWRQQPISIGSGTFPVTWLEVNPRDPLVQLRPIWSDPAAQPGTSPLVTMARQWQSAAAINAGFFNRNNRLPLGAIRRDNRWFSGPILNRGAIAWSNQGDLLFNRLTVREAVFTDLGETLPLFSLNSGYVGTGISRYTREWGEIYTPILANETILVVQQNQIVDQRFAQVAGEGTFPIPSDGYLLVSRDDDRVSDRLPLRSNVQLSFETLPDAFDPFPHIVGAGPLLLANNQIVLNAQQEQFSTSFAQQQAARSAIGRTAGDTLLLVAVQRRINGRGPTLGEMAQILQQLGAIDGLNLDGGSSTSLYLGGQLINRPPHTAARVHNGIGIFAQPAP